MGNSDRRKFIDTLFKMDTTIWLSLVVAVITISTPASASEPRVVCYYTNWSVYRPGTARFNPQNINPYLCTHLIYAFGGFTKDNTLKPFDKYQDIEKGGYAKFTGLKTYNKNLKTLLAIGGWNEGSSRFSPMVASREKRREFVRNAIKFLRQNRFDGLDLDWEYPAFRDGGKPKDRENYSKLVKELREEFEKEAEKTGKPRLLLTMAVPAGIEYIQKGFDVKTLNQYLDWMNLLTYDYHSAFEPAVNHHAPLYPLEEPNEYSVDNELNIDYTIKFYLENGADRDKLVLGIPTYGRSYTLFNPDATEIGAPADGPGEQGDATREKGYLAYYEICEALKPKQKKRSTSDEDSEEESEEVEDQPWTVVQPNPSAMGPVAYRGNQWVGYDDVDIVKKKAEYVAENGLGGIMFWSIDNDDFRGSCHGKPYPLIEAAKEAYIVRLGSTDNAIVTDRPRVVTTVRSTSNRRRNRPRTTTTTQSTATKSNKRKSSSSVTSTTPTWNIITPEPPTTPDPGSDFKCTDEGFFPHPRDCKKYFWCLDSGPSNLGIVAHAFTCPSGLFFNKAADSCDFARNVLCKKPGVASKAPPTAAPSTTPTPTTKRPAKATTKSVPIVRSTTTTTTTPEPEEEEYEDDIEDAADIEAEDPRVIKELIDLIKKVGGVEQLEKHLHLAEGSVSTDGAVTTTPSSFNKKLYQKVLERTRGKTKFNGNNVLESINQFSRRGPQNEGLEATADKDRLIRKDRPQYTTINRARSSSSTAAPEEDEDLDDIAVNAPQQQVQSRAVEEPRVGSTAKPLQYVNIRRARPLATSDTADDTASRNALFERSESYVSISEAPNSLDISSARRENIPEYVTIRRQRPTTEEAVTEQYQNTEAEDSQETALEREISSPQLSSQPQYTSINRVRSTTTTTTVAPKETTTPEPTTVLAVQISSLLNSPESSEVEDEDHETTIAEATEAVTTTTTSTTTPAPSTAPTRRPVQRRRGTTTTTQATPSSTQVPKRPFLRRTKATAAPDTINPEIEVSTVKYSKDNINKYTRRNNFKSRTTTELPESSRVSRAPEENEGAKTETAKTSSKRPPSLNTGARSERPRNFVRRRLGGANATSTSTSSSTPAPAPVNHRPFRVSSRRRPTNTRTTTTVAPPTTAEVRKTTEEDKTTTAEVNPTTDDVRPTAEVKPTTVEVSETPNVPLFSEETDITDVDEETALLPGPSTKNKAHRRPQLLKPSNGDSVDQNPSATNEDERKRHSKKYSSRVKQNQLEEIVKRVKGSQEDEDVTTDSGKTTVIDDAETALAIAAHQLLSAPLPSVPNYDEDSKPSRSTKKTPTTTFEYKYTSPAYTDKYIDTKTTFDDYSSTPIYKTTIANPDFQTTTIYDISLNPRTTTFVPRTSTYPSTPFTAKISRPAAFTASILSEENSEFSRTQSPTANPGFSRGSTQFSRVTTSNISKPPAPFVPAPSTTRYVGSDKLIPIPVEDYSLAPERFASLGQEPTYFTREYLLESPVTKTYDDEYQYLSPTTPQTTTRKIPKKIAYRKISTTIRPTLPPETYVPEITVPTPRRVPARKPFEKLPVVPVKSPGPNRYRPIDNYDYYDDGSEKLAEKYDEGTKVVLHSKGTIECLDIGNFPHPTSCKKFISCAKLENGSFLGWEYVCPKGLSFDPVGGICNWSAGLGCNEKDIQ